LHSTTISKQFCFADVGIIFLTSFVLLQVGDGTKLDRPTPVDVSGLSIGVMSVALGWVFAFFVVCHELCWGLVQQILS
jgi:hypothetical protein